MKKSCLLIVLLLSCAVAFCQKYAVEYPAPVRPDEKIEYYKDTPAVHVFTDAYGQWQEGAKTIVRIVKTNYGNVHVASYIDPFSNVVLEPKDVFYLVYDGWRVDFICMDGQMFWIPYEE